MTRACSMRDVIETAHIICYDANYDMISCVKGARFCIESFAAKVHMHVPA